MRKIPSKTVVAVALAIVVLASGLAAAWTWSDEDDSPKANPTQTGDCREQPWSECSPDADWLRTVLARAGYGQVVRGTGSALVIPDGGPPSDERYIWATHSSGALNPQEYSPYRPTRQVDGIPIYTDDIRLVWQVQKRNVYVEPPPENERLVSLVRATAAIRSPE